MKTKIIACAISFSATVAHAGCQEHWDARGQGGAMQDFCTAVEGANAQGHVIIMKKKPKGCSPKGPTSECNPASSILEDESPYNGLMWFDADGGFGFDMKDRLGSSGNLVGENGSEPYFFHDLQRLETSGAVELQPVGDGEEWFVATDQGTGDLAKFNEKIMRSSGWVQRAIQNGTSVIFLQQDP